MATQQKLKKYHTPFLSCQTEEENQQEVEAVNRRTPAGFILQKLDVLDAFLQTIYKYYLYTIIKYFLIDYKKVSNTSNIKGGKK